MKPPTAAVLAALVLALLGGCLRTDTRRAREELIAADKALSESSAGGGPRAALLEAIARDGKLLSNDRAGADAVNDAFLQYPPNVRLTWEPAFAEVSALGDLGYTWGRYVLAVPMGGKGAAPLVRRGTYVTVWRKELGGAWKIVLTGQNVDGSH